MTRRLALVIVGVVVTTLLLAGAGTLALATVRARADTERDLRSRAVDIAANIDQVLTIDAPLDSAEGRQQIRNRLRLLTTLRAVAPIDLAVLIADARGVLTGEDLPGRLTLDDIRPDAMARGETVTGSRGRLAFAAAPVVAPNGRLLVVVTSSTIDAGLGAAVRLFVWAGVATIVLGLGAAYLLGQRLTRPIREASAATQRIARGDFTTRLAEPLPDDHDELAELTRSVNAMAATLDRSRDLEQQFLLSVSHDLRTPLTSIRGYAEAIDDGNIDPKRAAAVIRSESSRLERLVADLLDLAKLQAKAFRFAMVPLDLSAAVHTALVGAAGSRTGVTFHPVTSGPLPVVADPDRLGQVLANLVENAGKYARSNVLVSARSEGGWAVVTVDDDGPGIAPHDLPHVFERLYVARLAPERKENASGLGLAIVRELVSAMGGDVGAGVATGGGARLWFRLPLRSSTPPSS